MSTAVKQALKRFLERDPYAFRVEPYDNFIIQRMILLTDHTPARRPSVLVLPRRQRTSRMLISSIVVRVIGTPRPEVPFPALRWGVIVGEIVHDLASALDNLVNELVEINPSPPQPPPGANRDARNRFKRLRFRQEFPYSKTREQWNGALMRDLLYVQPALQTVLEEAQPFYAWENFGIDPESNPLTILHELWLRDKHRTVNLTVAAAALNWPNLELPGLFPGHGYLSSETVIGHPVRPIEGETELAVIRVRFPYAIEFTPKMEVSVKPNMTLGILFGEGTPGAGQNIFDVLQRARDATATLLNRFA